MKIRKKTIWGLILLLFILSFIITIALVSFRGTSSILSTLGVGNIEAERIDGEGSGAASYGVYKLPDAAVNKFLKKENKELNELKGYKKLNWTRWPIIDSLCRMTDSLRYTTYDLSSEVYSLRRNLGYIDSLRDPIDSLSRTVFSLSHTVDSLCNIVYPLHYLDDPLCRRVNNLNRTINSLHHVAYLLTYPIDSLDDTVKPLRYTVDTLSNIIGDLRYTVDTLSNIIDDLSSIEETVDSFLNSKKYSCTVRKSFYNGSYYALHYKHPNLFVLYLLDEKNKLFYVADYWL